MIGLPEAQTTRRTVLLVGKGPTAASALESLAPRFRVLGVVRDPAGADDPVATLAGRLGIVVYPDEGPRGLDRLVERLRPDAVVISSYDRILGPTLLARSRFVNVHYAPLPRYRGRANVNWAIINDEPCAAISIHTVVPGLDAGNLLFQRLIPIGSRDTAAVLYERLNAIQRDELAAAVLAHLDGHEGVPQEESEATYGCSRVPADGLIDWSSPTLAIDRLVRALADPFPGAFTFHQGRRLTVRRAEPVEDPPDYRGRVAGRVVSISARAGTVDVLTGDGILRLCEVQLDGGQRAAAASVVRSVRDTLGLGPLDLWERIRDLERQLARLTEARTP